MSVRAYKGKRGNRWQVVIETGPDPETGKRKQAVIRRDPETRLPIASKKRAQEIEREELVKRARPGYVDPAVTPLAAYLERWLLETKDTRAPSTHYNWQSIVQKRINPALGTILLADLTPLAIQSFYRECAPRYTRSSLETTHRVLCGALRAAVRWRLLETSPAADITLPKTTKPARERNAWTPDEARALLAGTKDDTYGALWRLLYDSGMRIGEALALRWSDLDAESGRVFVWRTVSIDGTGKRTIVERTKTASSKRPIILSEPTLAALKRHRVQQRERELASTSWGQTDLIFDRGDGGMLDPRDARYYLMQACKAAGVPYVTLHGIRRTSITIAVAEGEPLHAVSRRAGHKSVSITDKIYALPSEEADERVSATLARVAEGA